MMYKVGAKIEHTMFGTGTILEVFDNKLKIQFESEIKIISKDYFERNNRKERCFYSRYLTGRSSYQTNDEDKSKEDEFYDEFYEEMIEDARIDYGYLEDEEFGPEDGYYDEHYVHEE